LAKVKECAKHPDADKLSVTKVDAGTGELLQIVCGAPNVAAGQKVVGGPGWLYSVPNQRRKNWRLKKQNTGRGKFWE